MPLLLLKNSSKLSYHCLKQAEDAEPKPEAESAPGVSEEGGQVELLELAGDHLHRGDEGQHQLVA